ncbi:amidase [Microbacterium sp. LWH7-1.2]|jgi:amidase|uniref:amidase n=1 Tax=Microbacterium sp. LWH7-1.2 TaxID=3135257 RepID=UPI003138919D
MSTDELWRLDATDQAAAIRERRVTARDVVQSHLDRIRAVNPITNAVVRELEDEALQAADAADAALAAGEPVGPLHGVPVTVKTNLGVRGQVTDESNAAFSDNLAEEDSPPVGLLRRAGAIFHGRTNMPDLGMRWNTDNPLYGPTRNPWDPNRTPGGSSGGDAAAVATGMTPIGLGNDFGGSIRLPAAYNGVVGLRPTPGRIPYAPESPEDRGMGVMFFYTDGPIARSVRDVRLAFDVLRQEDARDPFWEDAPTGPVGPCDVVMLRDTAGAELDPEVLQGLEVAADALRDAGYTVREGEMPSLQRAAELWRDIVATELSSLLTSDFLELFSEDAQRWVKASIGTSNVLDTRGYVLATAERAWIAAEWSQRMSSTPLILGPVDTGVAWDVSYDRTGDVDAAVVALRDRYTLNLAGSLLGLATATLPAGVGASGMPNAVQIAGWRFQEGRALAAAAAVESRVGVFTPRDPVAEAS